MVKIKTVAKAINIVYPTTKIFVASNVSWLTTQLA